MTPGAGVPPGEAAPVVLGPDADGTRVVMVADRIVASGRFARSIGAPDVPCPGTRIAPGRVNAHTHLYSGLAPLGMPRPARELRNFLEILERIWWRLDRALDAETLRAAARLYVAEALLAGTTALVDHHESPAFLEGSLDVLADACEELGMRAVLCFGATERNGGPHEGARGLAECRRFLATNRRPLLRGVVGLHASFTVSDGTAAAAGDLARETGTVTHVHLAEDVADVDDARRRGEPGPLQRLLRLGALPPGSILAHGVHLSVDEVRAAEEHGLWLVQNPRSNRGNRVGYPRALAASRKVALGTDGYPARMEDEIAVLQEEAAAHGDDPAAVRRRPDAGRDLLAERFGMPFTAFEAGAAADVVARRSRETAGAGGERGRSTTSGAAPPANDVLHVVVGGRVVVRDGRLVTGDLDAIRAEAADAAPRLWRRMTFPGED